MKKILGIVTSAVALMGLASCTVKDSQDTVHIVDMIEREVEVPKEINKVLCIGAGSLRLYSYLGDMEKLCGVEDLEKTKKGAVSIRPYQLANEELFQTLKTCGVGGPSGSAEAEKIIECDPDIIFSLYTSDKKAMDDLETRTGTPVVTLSYGDNAPFNDITKKSIELMGSILGKEERALKINEYIDGVKEDISTRTKNIKEEDKPSVYLGCNSSWGTHGIESTSANYAPFNIANISNATTSFLKNTDKTASDVDLEAILAMSPDKMILDAGGIQILKNQFQTQKDVISSIPAVTNQEVYLQMPFNAYYTNIDIALINAYFDASSVYPSLFSDINIEEKAGEIFTFLLGKNVYPEVKTQMYQGYQKITNLEEFLK